MSIDKEGYAIVLRLHRNDVSAMLQSGGMSEEEADKKSRALTDEQLEDIADEMGGNEAYMDDFWMTLEWAYEEITNC